MFMKRVSIKPPTPLIGASSYSYSEYYWSGLNGLGGVFSLANAFAFLNPLTHPLVHLLGICGTPEHTAPDLIHSASARHSIRVVATCRFRFFGLWRPYGHKNPFYGV